MRLRLLAVVAALLAACSTSQPSVSDAPPGRETARPTTTTSFPSASSEGAAGTTSPLTAPEPGEVPRVDWEPCGDFECGAVEVPLDHDGRDDATIRIALIRLAASDGRRGSIFVNPGGPGASGIDFVRGGFRLDDETMDRYDLVGFDPRGVGASTPIGCDVDRAIGPLPDTSPDTDEEADRLDAEAASFARRCAAGDARLLGHVDTESVARDLELLRRAVGDEQLHYYGFSFGTLIGQVYAALFPDRVGHLVLDGVVDPTASLPDLLSQQAMAFESAFDGLDAACGTRLACPDGGIVATYDRVLADLERTGPVGEVGPTEFEYAAIVALYSEALWPRYSDGLTRAGAGDLSGIEALSDLFVSGVSFAAYAAVECSDSPRPSGPTAWDRFAADLAAAAPRFGAAVANELRTCAFWPVEPRPRRDPVRAAGSRPIVVIGTTNDPATPLDNARRVADALESATLVVVDADRHTAYRSSPCVQRLVRDYFVDDVLPRDPGTGDALRC